MQNNVGIVPSTPCRGRIPQCVCAAGVFMRPVPALVTRLRSLMLSSSGSRDFFCYWLGRYVSKKITGNTYNCAVIWKQGFPANPGTALLFAAGPANRQQIKSRSGAVYVTQEKAGEALQELACLSASLAHFITGTSRRPHLVFLYPICKPVTLSLRGVWSVSPPDSLFFFFFLLKT